MDHAWRFPFLLIVCLAFPFRPYDFVCLLGLLPAPTGTWITAGMQTQCSGIGQSRAAGNGTPTVTLTGGVTGPGNGTVVVAGEERSQQRSRHRTGSIEMPPETGTGSENAIGTGTIGGVAAKAGIAGIETRTGIIGGVAAGVGIAGIETGTTGAAAAEVGIGSTGEETAATAARALPRLPMTMTVATVAAGVMSETVVAIAAVSVEIESGTVSVVGAGRNGVRSRRTVDGTGDGIRKRPLEEEAARRELQTRRTLRLLT